VEGKDKYSLSICLGRPIITEKTQKHKLLFIKTKIQKEKPNAIIVISFSLVFLFFEGSRLSLWACKRGLAVQCLFLHMNLC